MTCALDVDPGRARPWIDAAVPTHPSLIDTEHATDEAFGFVNVPMAVWIDEDGMIVRPAEQASIEERLERDVPDALPDRLKTMLGEVNKIADVGARYRAAVVDWAERGTDSQYVMTPEEVVARSQPRPVEHARAAACFELGNHLRRTIGPDAAVSWWREAHRLFPENWTYKRQAWTLVTTPTDALASDLIQGPTDVYEGNWLDDVLAAGGGDRYYPASTL